MLRRAHISRPSALPPSRRPLVGFREQPGQMQPLFSAQWWGFGEQLLDILLGLGFAELSAKLGDVGAWVSTADAADALAKLLGF